MFLRSDRPRRMSATDGRVVSRRCACRGQQIRPITDRDMKREPHAMSPKTDVHVRFGSSADTEARLPHLRFTPESGHPLASRACPLCARSGHGAASIKLLIQYETHLGSRLSEGERLRDEMVHHPQQPE